MAEAGLPEQVTAGEGEVTTGPAMGRLREERPARGQRGESQGAGAQLGSRVPGRGPGRLNGSPELDLEGDQELLAGRGLRRGLQRTAKPWQGLGWRDMPIWVRSPQDLFDSGMESRWTVWGGVEAGRPLGKVCSNLSRHRCSLGPGPSGLGH